MGAKDGWVEGGVLYSLEQDMQPEKKYIDLESYPVKLGCKPK